MATRWLFSLGLTIASIVLSTLCSAKVVPLSEVRSTNYRPVEARQTFDLAEECLPSCEPDSCMRLSDNTRLCPTTDWAQSPEDFLPPLPRFRRDHVLAANISTTTTSNRSPSFQWQSGRSGRWATNYTVVQPPGLDQQQQSSLGPGHNISKRLFTLDPARGSNGGRFRRSAYTVGDIDAYILGVYGKVGPNRYTDHDYFGYPKPLYEIVGDRETDAAVSQMIPYGNKKAFQIMTGALRGCTVVTVVSRRAVWMAHFWETYSNGKPNTDSPIDTPFRERVLHHITRGTNLAGRSSASEIPGVEHPQYKRPLGDRIRQEYFNREDDNTGIYIMTPLIFGKGIKEDIVKGDLKDYLKYPARVQAIIDTIRDHLGGDDVVNPKVAVYGYNRYEGGKDDPRLGSNARSHALFQYDRDANPDGRKGWRLFYEREWTVHYW